MSKLLDNKYAKNVAKFFTKPEEKAEQQEILIGDHLGFDGVEAFNLLRTNLMFSFSDEKKCHIVAVSSPIPGSGKSLVSSNLAYSIAKMNKKVLLIDGDLRLPTVHKKLNLNQKPGLSNILVSAGKASEIIQHFNGILDVITAGDIPPKPSELLGSGRMEKLLSVLTEYYEYIIIDSPPITVVPDTLVMAKFLDGVILVTRKEHDEKNAVKDSLRQLELSKARVLGLVFNNGENEAKAYGYGYGYKRYGYGRSGYGKSRYGKSRYGSNGYGRSYKKAAEENTADSKRYGAAPTLKEVEEKAENNTADKT